ncbi:MAG: ABC transporter permease [Desulfotignum balticum]|jgi:tungstate transport system permease protein|uniref:ABC transporter permease n=1 Tax=Desulfotignum balticum TaxID=115781 RepID=A0A931GCH8_9BACT|nr:ABC transporter permease [Desulfotignum balticum]
MDYIVDGFIKAFLLLIHLDPATTSAITATLKVSTIAMIVSLTIGLPLGFVLGYFDFPGKRHIKTLVDTLLALPTVCIGLIVYALISSRGPLGEWHLLFTLTGIAMGLTVLALPIVIAITAATVENIDSELKLTLVSLGAGRHHILRTCLWEVRYGILAGVVTAYGRVLTEVGIAMMVGGNIKYHTRTMTTAIALETNKGQFADGIALGIVLIVIALCVNICLSFLRKQ